MLTGLSEHFKDALSWERAIYPHIYVTCDYNIMSTPSEIGHAIACALDGVC